MSVIKKFIAAHTLEESIQYLVELTRSKPEQHELWQTLAELFEQKGDSNRANAALHQYELIKIFNDNLQLARQHLMTNNLAGADKLCRQLLTQVPNELRALRLMAEIAIAAARADVAVNILSECNKLKPDDRDIVREYIHALNSNKQYQLALEVVDKLLPSAPLDTNLLSAKALAEVKTGAYEQALNSYQKLLANHPNKAVCFLRLGNVQKILGQTTDAITSCHQAIQIDPSLGEAYWNLANTKKYRFSPAEVAQMKEQLTLTNNHQQNIALLNFALGKALEDEGLYEQSFFYYQQGNKLCKEGQAVTSGKNKEQIKQFFSREFFASRADCGHPSDEVIFIIGLPRSGSTLVEQILASHSLVDGTMELNKVPLIANDLDRAPNGKTGNYPHSLASLSENEIKILAQSYLNYAAPFRQNGRYFIDKLPANFLHVGLIKAVFPRAKIIDVRRHPMACGWSIYKQFFASGVTYAYDLEDIAGHYNHYTELMEHWNAVLPGEILNVNYEDLISDFQETVRQIVMFCGLDMEDACLNFHENKRPVATPSAEQVRQPIYTQAIDHWRHYEAFLAPLAEGLKPIK